MLGPNRRYVLVFPVLHCVRAEQKVSVSVSCVRAEQKVSVSVSCVGAEQKVSVSVSCVALLDGKVSVSVSCITLLDGKVSVYGSFLFLSLQLRWIRIRIWIQTRKLIRDPDLPL